METKLIIRCSWYSRHTCVPPLPSLRPILIIFHYHLHHDQSVVCTTKIIRHFLFQQIHVLHPPDNHFVTLDIPPPDPTTIQLAMEQEAIFADIYVQF